MSAIALAESLLQSGNATGARQILKDSADPGPERDYLLARCALRLGDTAAALVALASVVDANPRHVEATSALGALHVKQGKLDKAEALYSKALKKVDDERLRLELAVVYWKRKQSVRALQELERVLARNPRHHAARNERAFMLLSQSRFAEAAEEFRILVRDDPDRLEPWGHLGMLEFKVGRYEAALPLLREAQRRQPRDGAAIYNVGMSLVFTGHIEEGAAMLERLREVDPPRWQDLLDSTADSRIRGTEELDVRPLFLLIAYNEQTLCDWTHRQRYEEVYHDFVADPRNSRPIRLAHGSGIVPLSHAERRRMMEMAGRVAALGCTPHEHLPSPAPRRLRVGYVMTRIAIHVVPKILVKLIESHDPANVDVSVVSVLQQDKDYSSGMPERYMAIPGVTWVDLTHMSDAEAVEHLKSLDFDILIDLSVYNDGARSGLFAGRPAPVQVNFLGAPFTSGVPWMDYIITDPVVSPAVPDWCSEAEARMPVCFFTYGSEWERPAVPPRTGFGLPEDAFVYSGLNNSYKIDPLDFDGWMRILTATPGSVLMLREDSGAQENLRREAERRGVDPARLIFAPFVTHEGYLQRQGMPDLFLDTRYYGAHTTMAESLWMGVPALTCPGDAFPSRVGASLLASCGLQELIMPDWDSYEATAIALYHDRERLRRLKDSLLSVRDHAAPFDMPGQARNMEKAFRHMRERFAQGLPPAAFNVGELPD